MKMAAATEPTHSTAVTKVAGGSDEADAERRSKRPQWDSQVDALLSLIGFAVDLGNVWRFPYICYRNGGGAFLIPYLVCFIFGGLPILYLELIIGQYFQTGCISVWSKTLPIVKGVGYSVIIVNLFIATYYNVVIGMSIYYFVSSFAPSDKLPWASCDNQWNSPNCVPQAHTNFEDSFTSVDLMLNGTYTPAQEFLNVKVLKIVQSSGFGDFGGVSWLLVACTISAFGIIYIAIARGVKSSGKVVWVTATAPYLLLGCLLIRGVTLPGAAEGLKFYLVPEWDKLLELSVWRDAGQQLLFSLGTGFGAIMALSSYNKFSNNIHRDALISGTTNCLTSFFAGLVVFSTIGYLSHVTNRPVDSVVQEGPALVFEVYPAALAEMPLSNLWSILFFLMLITLGLDSSFGGFEALITGLLDEFNLSEYRQRVVAIVIIIVTFGSLPSLTYGGQFWIGMVDFHACTNSLTLIVLVQLLAFVYGFGVNNIVRINKEMLGSEVSWFWRVCWLFFSPLFISSVAVISFVDSSLMSHLFPEVYPVLADVIGLCLMGVTLAPVPLYAGYCLYTHRLHYGSWDVPSS